MKHSGLLISLLLVMTSCGNKAEAPVEEAPVEEVADSIVEAAADSVVEAADSVVAEAAEAATEAVAK